MKKETIVQKLEALLEQKGLESKQVDLGRSTAVGANNIVLFDVIDGGFIVTVNPDQLKELENRPEASMVTENYVPTNDKLFIDIKENDGDTILFWGNEGLKRLYNTN